MSWCEEFYVIVKRDEEKNSPFFPFHQYLIFFSDLNAFCLVFFSFVIHQFFILVGNNMFCLSWKYNEIFANFILLVFLIPCEMNEKDGKRKKNKKTNSYSFLIKFNTFMVFFLNFCFRFFCWRNYRYWKKLPLW